jgi:hypothetical protein
MAETRQTRRALLTAAASGAAALAANAALGASVVKAVGEPPLLMGVSNSPSTPASTALGTALALGTVLDVTNADTTGPNKAIQGNSATGTGLAGYSTSGGSAGVYGAAGDDSAAPSDTSLTGVFGYGVAGDGVTTFGAGVWGDSPDFGVYGSGGTGVVGDGGTDGWGVYGWSSSSYGVYGESSTGNALMGVSASGYGLYVEGKVKFATRSGRSPSIAKGKTSWVKTLAGVTSSSIVIAVLQQAETGTWVRAAVAGSGKFTVYFNKALPTSSVVGWMILN